MVRLNRAHVKGASANLGKKTVTVSFEMVLDEESRKAAEDIAFYIGKGPLVVVVNPQQMPMEFKVSKVNAETGEVED